MSAFANLIRSSVDYAGLFPPAKLELDQVVKNFAQYVQDNRHQMLARLILPTARLAEFDNLASSNQLYDDTCWRISALVPPIEVQQDGLDTTAFQASMASIAQFNQRDQSARSIVDAIEIRSANPETTRQIGEAIPDNIQAFLELDWRKDPSESVKVIAQFAKPNLFAKIRTGGVTEDLIPPASQIAKFLLVCAQHQVGLKATAGLHHPIRSDYRLTYEPDAAYGTMHGFINVFVAACLAFDGQVTDTETLTTVLNSQSRDDFQLGNDHIGFRDFQVSAARVREIRETRMTSFGSCSFSEPSVELEEMFGVAD